MTRTRRLNQVVQHTDKKEQQALQQVALSRGALEVEQQRLARLHEYRLEYQQKKGLDRGLFTPVELQDYNRFLEQLDQTILRQAELVELRQRELEQKRQLWTLTRIDSKKMHKLVDKLQHQEVVERERKEQKALDEFAQRGQRPALNR